MKDKGWLLVVVIVALGLLPTISLQAQEPGFTETFDDPALPGWEHSPNVAVVDGVLRVEPGGFAFRHGEWGDLSLNVRARSAGQGHAVLLVTYRASNAGDYTVLLGPDFVALQRKADGVGTELGAGPVEFIPPGEWFQVSVIVAGEAHEVMLNNELALAVADPDPLPTGGVSLSAQGDAAGEFDDLVVIATGQAPPPAEARPTPKPSPPAEEPPPSEGKPPPEEPAPQEPPARPDDLGAEAPPEPGADAQPPSATGLTWVRTGGPPGGLGYDIRYNFGDPNVWYATDNFAGVHISTDNGLTWLPSTTGIPKQLGPTGDWIPIFSLTVDPHDPQIVWAGTDKTGHIYKSTDAGRTWAQKDNGVASQTSEYDALSFRGFTVDPRKSDIVYAMGETEDLEHGGANVWGTAVGGVVYKTTDGGENWELLWNGGVPSSLARYMWINPENPDILYVSTGIFDRGAVNEGDPETDPDPYGGLGILKSTDGGESWRVLNKANGLNFLYIGSLFMHPDDPDILLAAAGKLETDLYLEYIQENNLPNTMGVYRTTDGGETWAQVLDAGGFNSVEMCPSDPNIAYAGSAAVVYRSEDAGQTWTQVAGQGDDGWGPPGVLAGVPIDMQCDPNDPNRIFANNYLGGNFVSEDGGRTWKNASDGYTGAQITSVTIDPQNPAQIYVAGRNGIWASSDGGSSWYGLRYPPPKQPVWGVEWGGIVVDPSDSKHLLVSEETLWESFDGGSSWEVRRSPAFALAAAIVFAPSDPNTVYTGRADPICLLNIEAPCVPGGGVYVSHDGGTTWNFANDSNIADLTLIDLAVDPANAQVVYAATERGLFKTTNGGTAWTLISGLPAGTRVGAIVMHPQDSQHLIAGVEGQGLFISTDGGQAWQQIAAGLEPNSSIRDILFDPTNPQVVYLTDLVSGVYRSTDDGHTWEQINDGLTMRSATGLAISSDGQHVYVATNGGGVFRLDVSGQPPQPAPGATPVISPTPTPVAAAPTSTPPPAQPTAPPEVAPGPTPELPEGRGICGGAAALPLVLLGLVWVNRRRR